MPLFGSLLRDFGEDPFFGGGGPREQIRQMENMMNNFVNPFESLFGDMGMGFPRLMAPDDGGNNSRRHPEMGLTPFGFGRDLMFPNMRNMFADFERMAGDPNCHSFSSSSVYTYSTSDDGIPQIYQASSSTRTAPGGVKETRKTVCDSESGLKKMSIGHHLNERAHIVERTQYANTNDQEEAEELINLSEDQVETFNQEWQTRTRPLLAPHSLEHNAYRQRRHNHDNELKSLPAPRKRDIRDVGHVGGEKSRRKGNEKHKQPRLKSRLENA